MDAIEARLRERAGNPSVSAPSVPAAVAKPETEKPVAPEPATTPLALPEAEIDALIRRFKK